IVFDGPGYVLAISQQIDLMRWRVAGLDTARQPIMLATTHMKRLDSRHPFLEELAEYAKRPIAPVVLTVGRLPIDLRGRVGAMTAAFESDWSGHIWLPGLDIYTEPSERPADSMARLESEVKQGQSSKWPPKQKTK